MSKYKAVIFDLFGTLIPNYAFSAYRESVLAVAGALKVPAEEFWRIWMEYFDKSTIGLFDTTEEKVAFILKQMGFQAVESQIKSALQTRYRHESATMLPRPEAEPVLGEIKQKGLKIGLITDCSPEAPLTWPETTIAAYFDATIFSCEVKVRKPDPRIYQMALEALKVQAGECLYVGDGNSQEHYGAKTVGMTAVLFKAPGEFKTDDFRNEQARWADTTITSLSQIIDILDSEPA